MSSLGGPTIVGKRRCSAAMISVVSSTESVVCVMYASCSVRGSGSSATSSSVCTSTISSGASPIVPDDLLVAGVADQEDRVALRRRSAAPRCAPWSRAGRWRRSRAAGAARRCGAPRARRRGPRARWSRPPARPPRSRRRSRPAARAAARRGCCARSACARRSAGRAARASARRPRRRARRPRNTRAGARAADGMDGWPKTRPEAYLPCELARTWRPRRRMVR